MLQWKRRGNHWGHRHASSAAQASGIHPYDHSNATSETKKKTSHLKFLAPQSIEIENADEKGPGGGESSRQQHRSCRSAWWQGPARTAWCSPSPRIPWRRARAREGLETKTNPCVLFCIHDLEKFIVDWSILRSHPLGNKYFILRAQP